MRPRRRARGWTLQVLYAWDARGAEDDPRHFLQEFLAARRVAPESRGYIQRLLGVIAEHGSEIDALLQEALTNWRIERLSAIDRNILRLAAAEIVYLEDVPPRVSIHEAIGLAERYGTAESPRFVNGVLDALLRRVGGAGRGEGDDAEDPGR